MPPGPAAVIVPVLPFKNVDVPGDVPVEEENVVAVTEPLMVTSPASVMTTAPVVVMAADTVTPSFAEFIVTEASAVPLPTGPPKLTEPAPAVMARVFAGVDELTVPPKVTFPPPEVIRTFVPRLTLSFNVTKGVLPPVVMFPFRVVVPPALVISKDASAPAGEIFNPVAPRVVAVLEVRVKDWAVPSESTSPSVIPPLALMVTPFVSVTSGRLAAGSTRKIPLPRLMFAPSVIAPVVRVRSFEEL
jgi:hypothetical protein